MPKINGQEQIAVGTIVSADLAATGVTVGTYGDVTHAPVITVNAQGQIVSATLALISGSGSFTPGAVIAPSACVFDSTDYLGSIGYVTWRAVNTSAPSAGAIEFYGWQDSPDNATWNTETFHGDTYQGRSYTSGNQYARVRSYPLVTSGGSLTPSAWVVSTAQLYAAAPVFKRRIMFIFYPASSTADAAPNTTQVIRLPKTTAGAQSQWKLMSATLRVEGPNAAATTAQVYYVSNPGNAAFGAGTAILASALSAAGTTIYEVSTTVFTGSLATTGLPSGSLWAPQFSALGGTSASLEIEVEEV